jgi:hypothetical protein
MLEALEYEEWRGRFFAVKTHLSPLAHYFVGDFPSLQFCTCSKTIEVRCFLPSPLDISSLSSLMIR